MEKLVGDVRKAPTNFRWFTTRRGGGGYSLKFFVGVCRPRLQIQTQLQTKKCHFPHLFSDLASKIHTRFQTWPQKSIPVFRPGLKNPYPFSDLASKIHTRFQTWPQKSIPVFRPGLKNPYPFSDLASKIYTRFQTWPCTWLSIAYASVLNGS